jgi:hypothetical protein
MLTRTRRGRLALWIAALAIAAAAACDDQGPEPDDLVESMRLVVGSQTITVSKTGTIAGGPIVIGLGETSTAATFLGTTGNPMAGLDAFEVRVTSSNTGFVTFRRVSAFAGTLTRVAPGSAQLSVQLFHLADQRVAFGPFNVPITVQ